MGRLDKQSFFWGVTAGVAACMFILAVAQMGIR